MLLISSIKYVDFVYYDVYYSDPIESTYVGSFENQATFLKTIIIQMNEHPLLGSKTRYFIDSLNLVIGPTYYLNSWPKSIGCFVFLSLF